MQAWQLTDLELCQELARRHGSRASAASSYSTKFARASAQPRVRSALSYRSTSELHRAIALRSPDARYRAQTHLRRAISGHNSGGNQETVESRGNIGLDDLQTLGLTPKLERMVRAFGSMPEKRRVQQLLALAKKLPPLDPALRVSTNRVMGCQSTVYVAAFPDQEDPELLHFVGESDSQLTQGLLAVLIDGLSGSHPADIELVDPRFIQPSGIAASLTAGRNNGFLNMLALIKHKARELGACATSLSASEGTTPLGASLSPIGRTVATKLQMLKPAKLELLCLTDKASPSEPSDGSTSTSSEDVPGGKIQFELRVVAECFNGLTLAQRHTLIYTLLAQEMQSIRLQIDARTPLETGT